MSEPERSVGTRGGPSEPEGVRLNQRRSAEREGSSSNKFTPNDFVPREELGSLRVQPRQIQPHANHDWDPHDG